MFFTYIGGCRTIDKEHVCVTNACLGKFGPIVLGLIQAHDMRYTEVTEDLQVVLWGVTTAICPDLVHRAHKGDELARNYPVKITIFDLLIILVLLVVEVSEVVPSKIHSDLQSLQTMEYRATVGAVAVAGISVGPEAGLVRSKGLPGDLGRLAQDDHHEGSHKVGCVRLLVEHITRVVEQFHVLVPLVSQHPTELPDEFVRVCHVQWPKV